MSDENKKPIEINFVGFAILPEGATDISQAVARAMQIPDAILLNPESSHRKAYVDTSKLLPSITLTDTFNCGCVIETPQQRFERKMRQAVLDTVKEAGLHPDNVERINYALKSKAGIAAINKLALSDIRDVEGLAQKFLQIYRDITK